LALTWGFLFRRTGGPNESGRLQFGGINLCDKAHYLGGGSLFLLSAKTPALFYRVWNAKIKKDEHRVYILRKGVWEESEFGTVIGTDSWVYFRDFRIYVIRRNADDWSIHELNSLDVSKLPLPIYQFKVEDGLTVGRVFIHDRDTFILKLYDRQSTVHLRLFTRSGDRVASHDIQPPDDHLLESLRWTPNGDICAATNNLRKVRAYILQGDRTWKLVGEAEEPTGAMIHDPALAFTTDGKPIVTWEAFWP